MNRNRVIRSRRGITAIMALLFLSMAAALALGMYSASTTSTASASNMIEGDRARAAAESGLRWVSWRFIKMSRPKTTIGNITSTVATNLWPNIRTSITSDLNTMLTTGERTTTFDGTTFKTAKVAVDETSTSANGARFEISIRPHPLFTGDPLDSRYLRVTSTGTYKDSTRKLSVDFKVDKKVKFAVVGKVPIQLGRNVLVEGPMAMSTPNKYPPLFSLSDFRHLNSSLATKIDNFNTFLKQKHKGYDNRVSVNDPDELAKATTAGYSDYTGDSYIDEYDLFVKHYDTNNDKAVSKAEFTGTNGKLYDPDLFTAIDGLGAPLATGEANRAGYKDNILDNKDGYTKIRGQTVLATTASAWAADAASDGQVIQDLVKGPIIGADSTELPIKFGASSSEIFDLSPSNFDTSGFKSKTGTSAGTTALGGGATVVTIENKVLDLTDTKKIKVTSKGTTTLVVGNIYPKSVFDAANAGKSSTNKAKGTDVSVANAAEHTPFGSTSWQATYDRPVFKDVKFKNVRIPKGMNALFDNCTFEGVTYVELETNITNSSGQTTTNKDEAMDWSKKMKSGSFDEDTKLTASNSHGYEKGNNLRFNNCSIKGPLASDVPTAYSHFTNSFEFTGSTLFDNQVDQTATMVCPQTNVEMGSFTDPAGAPSTMVGVVVTGNLDIRGSSVVDGSVIVTGDGAGTTTLGWFGPSDSSTEIEDEMPEGGWGRMNIRYNPNRALPDGINVAVDILPETGTYLEGQ